ncbi:MAG: phosphatidylglycerophosphatase A, partial [Deltaproteobacteria bacterium]|nr:phosphatidylglycerophosphatase A [Deltaproteobacteria bacterium]
PAACTLALVLGLLPLSGLRLNYLNIIMIPVLFGISVDGAVHLVTRLTGGHGLVKAVNETGRAIAGAILTTGLGFGSLLLADHQGLDSLGELACLGLGANLIVCLVGLPAFLALRGIREARKAGPQPSGGEIVINDLATVGMSGESPLAPGTLGALAALPVAWVLSKLPWHILIAVLFLVVIVSVVVASRYVATKKDKDPSEVVIDEFVGCLVAVAFVPWDLGWVIAAFVLFRLFDIWKPWPISAIDRSLQGGIGVVLDDLLAGLFAGGLLFIFRQIAFTQG